MLIHTTNAESRSGARAGIGVAMLHSDDWDIGDALQRADRALYRAKERGRNRIEVEL